MTQMWCWDEKVSLAMDEQGRQGLNLPHFVPLPQLIAMAWRRRRCGTPTRLFNTRDDRGPHATYVRWEEEEEDDTGRIRDETWRNLSGKIGLVPMDRSRYQISSHGRLKNPQGQITRGHWWDGRYWAAIKDCGLLDLTSASKKRKEVCVPPSVAEAIDALSCAVHPSEFAAQRRVRVKSGWSYFTKAALHIRPSDLRTSCREIISPDLWDLLSGMHSDGKKVLGERLTDLLAVVEEEMPGFSKSRYSFEQLRLARMAILA